MPIDPHVLLTGVQTGRWDLSADAVELLTVVAYGAGVRRLARRGRRWPVVPTAAFTAGVAVVWIAVGSGLAAYDETSVTLHVVQHILLMMVAPPLLALGRPLTLASQAASRPVQSRIVRALRHPATGALTFPAVTGLLYVGSMVVYFVWTAAYDSTIDHPLAHDASHLVFLAVGCLYWQPLLGSDPTRWRLSHPTRILLIAAAMPFDLWLGLTLLLRTRPIDPINTLADTHAAGPTFWIIGMLVSAMWGGVAGLQWIADDERRTAREDRRAGDLAVLSAARAAEAGITDLPAGWTLPEWRFERTPHRAPVTFATDARSADAPPSPEEPSRRP